MRKQLNLCTQEIINLCRRARVKNDLKLVFHTEYQCIVWNLYELIDMYSRSIVEVVHQLKSHGLLIEFIELEFHPGFIATSRSNNYIKLSNLKKVHL